MREKTSKIQKLFSAMGGALLISLVAQVSIRLPWTSVPITGQTFGVALVALASGLVVGVLSVVLYLVAGAVGLPVFARQRAGLSWGPTTGYLVGMIFSALIIGTLSERGWVGAKRWRFFWAWAAAACGSLAVFACGLIVLAQFVERDRWLESGFFPFLPGDLIKNLLAAAFVTFVWPHLRRLRA